ncbi:MAG TPA: ACP phosphodiesterase, partial [Thermoanaerobaculia bacterium]|nr:ACP phosphodiesterase [Thermoanaerobaculia bacterium]
MNYLAHLFLAGDTPESRIGNLAGDFVKGRLGDSLDPAIRAGIVEHRKIDAFTDTHPRTAAFRRVLVPEFGHYARIIGDVFFDHFLANGFGRYSESTLEEFLRHVYSQIDPRASSLPGRLRLIYPRIRDEGWMLSYRTIDGIRVALENLSRRLSRRPQLAPAVRHLTD